MMHKRLIDALCGDQDVSAWTLREIHSRDYQSYLVGQKKETVRHVSHRSYSLTVYHVRRTDAGELMGSANMTLGSDDSGGEREAVTLAVRMAKLGGNPPYSLPGVAPLPSVEIVDPRVIADAAAAVDEAEDELISAVSSTRDVRLSSSELFASTSDVRLLTSTGVDASFTGTQVFWELVLLAGRGADEAEVYHEARRRRVSDIEIENAVSENARLVLDAVSAGAVVKGRRPVAIGGLDADQLYNAFAFNALGQSAYQKLSRFRVGESVFGEGEPTGDPFSYTCEGLLPFGTRTMPCDGEGLPARTVNVIENGVFRTMLASKRYADYLGVEPTYSLSNFTVAPGPTTQGDLLTHGTLLVERFSDFGVDDITGDFTAEIRLGYEIGDDGSRRPIKGGAVAGNIFSAMASARFSSETRFFGGSVVPALVLFPDLSVG
jgi:predicted Zn-dependent protease